MFCLIQAQKDLICQFPFVPIPAQPAQPGTRNLAVLPFQTVFVRTGPFPGEVATYTHGLLHLLLILQILNLLLKCNSPPLPYLWDTIEIFINKKENIEKKDFWLYFQFLVNQNSEFYVHKIMVESLYWAALVLKKVSKRMKTIGLEVLSFHKGAC